MHMLTISHPNPPCSHPQDVLWWAETNTTSQLCNSGYQRAPASPLESQSACFLIRKRELTRGCCDVKQKIYVWQWLANGSVCKYQLLILLSSYNSLALKPSTTLYYQEIITTKSPAQRSRPTPAHVLSPTFYLPPSQYELPIPTIMFSLILEDIIQLPILIL